MKLFRRSLGVAVSCRALNPQYHGGKSSVPSSSFVFRSYEGDGVSSRPSSAGMPFVKCYNGVNYGVLYPFEEGLLFFKPPRFVHRSKLHSISCGRGSGGSRYIDLVATFDTNNTNTSSTEETDDGKTETWEFNSIDRGEFRILNDYINGVLAKAMARDAAAGSESGGTSSDEGGSEGEGEDDAAVEVTVDGEDGMDSGRRSRGGRRTQRNASRAAQKATRMQLENRNNQDSDGEEDDDSADYQDDSEDEEESDSSDDDDVATETDDDESDDPTPARKRAKDR